MSDEDLARLAFALGEAVSSGKAMQQQLDRASGISSRANALAVELHALRRRLDTLATAIREREGGAG